MRHALTAGFCVIWAQAGLAQQDQPLSAIDWLSQSIRVPVISTTPDRPTQDEPPVANSATAPLVTTSPLNGASPDPIGLLAPSVTDLPRTLWAGSDEATLIALLQAQDIDGLPAMRDLLKTLVLAEADPPSGASSAGALFQARVDKLLDLGAIEPAQALLEQAQLESPDLFRRWFDVALLTGSEDRACRVMQRRIDVAPTYAARIFCLARGGDWSAAALSLNTHIALGDLTETEQDLLSRFLDPELFEDEDPLGPPARISPLMFRMYEAIGEPLNAATLPRAFLHADLRTTMGLKSQLEAAERLTRYGAIAPNVLFALYNARTPSASGGIWDRVYAVQAFDTAVRAGDSLAVSRTLPAAWEAAKDIQIETAFAEEYSAELLQLDLPRTESLTAYTIALLSQDFEAIAEKDPKTGGFSASIARGTPDNLVSLGPEEQAIVAAFTKAKPPARLTALAQNDQLGEAILRSIALFEAGRDGDTRALTDALSFLRAIGLEDVARRASLQLILLERDR